MAKNPPQPNDQAFPTGRARQEGFDWWGRHWEEPEPHSLQWLIKQGSIAVREAAFLSLAIEARRTLIVTAESPQAGKTTLLTALLDYLPQDIDAYFVRGRYERFAFVLDADPQRSYILCNEISRHLPTYLWGRGVRILFTALERGFPMATTMHASSGVDALARLRSYPLELNDRQLGEIDLIATIEMEHIDHRLTRRVTRIESPTQTDEGLVLRSLSRREPFRSPRSRVELGAMLRMMSDWFEDSDDEIARRFAARERSLRPR